MTYLSVLQVVSYLFPLITIPYLAKIIGTEGYGKIAFATAIMTWIITITDWGFNYTATRDVAKNKEDIEKISIVFSNVLWARLLLMFLSLIVLFILVLLIPYFKENYAVIFVAFLMIPGHILFPEWFFQALEKMKFISILNIVSKLVFTLAIFIFIKDKEDYILQPLFYSLGFVISGVISFYIILYKWNIKLIKPNLKIIYRTIHNSTDVFINNLMPNLYNSLSIIFLGFYNGNTANGIFDAANRIIVIAQNFFTIISRSFFPFLVRRSENFFLYEKINVISSLITSIFIFIFSSFIIDLFYTSEFEDAKCVLKIMSFSILFVTLSSTYGINYMIINGYDKELRNITSISSIIGFIIGFHLIKYYGVIGTALTIVVTRFILGISITFSAKIKQKIK